MSHSIKILLVDVNREKVSAENKETKVTKVCLVNVVQPGLGGNQVKTLGASKANMVSLVMMGSQAMMEPLEHLVAQVKRQHSFIQSQYDVANLLQCFISLQRFYLLRVTLLSV